MARHWLVDGRTIAKKVKNPTWSSASQSQSSSRDSGTNRECPNCHYFITNSDEWPGLPTGVKFDPTDAEILEHLAAKCGVGDAKPHPLIDEFIPTLAEQQGICYTHPKDLPGAQKNGSSMHYFHRTINAYATGQRKRRKIQSNQDPTTDTVRWHKTGKTKPIVENGVHKGWKKIMVLYKSANKGCKPNKSNWVMHQYHLGTDEDEKEGDFVVSKISYQPEKPGALKVETPALEEAPCYNEGHSLTGYLQSTSPKTPKPIAPPPFVGKASPIEDMDNCVTPLGDDDEWGMWLAGESQAYEDHEFQGVQDSLLCKEILDPNPSNQGLGQVDYSSSRMDGALTGIYPASCGSAFYSTNYGLSHLAKLEFDSPPDFLNNDLPPGSQESLLDWTIGLV